MSVSEGLYADAIFRTAAHMEVVDIRAASF
jgi:hypothetical protein